VEERQEGEYRIALQAFARLSFFFQATSDLEVEQDNAVKNDVLLIH